MIQQKYNKYKNDLDALVEPMDKYHYLIKQGKDTALDDEYKIDSFNVNGCQSTVYLVPKHNNNTIDFMADSNSAITKGLATIVADIFSGSTKLEIQGTDINTMIDGLQLPTILSPSRRNGAFNMFKKIKDYAKCVVGDV
jgi:cysteine desulfuration protein SufE